MIKEKLNCGYTGLMSKTFIPIIIALTIIKFVYNMDKEFIFIIEIFSLIIPILIYSTILFKNYANDIEILRMISLGYLLISIIRIIFINIVYVQANENIIIVFNQFFIYLEFINIVISIIFYKNNYSKNTHFISMLFIIIINVIANVTFYKYWNYSFNNNIIIVKTNFLFGIVLFVYISFLYKKFKVGKNYKWILEINAFIFLSNLFMYLNYSLNMDFIYFICISKLLSYLILYNEFEKGILYNLYLNLYRFLNDAKEKKENLYKDLKKREKVLKDANLLLEKSEKNYCDLVQAFSKGLLLFENGLLIYTNYFDEIFNISDINRGYNKERITLDEVLSTITGKRYSNSKILGDFSKEVRIRNKSGKMRDYEIYLISINKNKKLLVFYDITDVIKQREEIIKIEKKIKEQNLNDEFYSNISHELRTPINVIYSAIQLNNIYVKENRIHDISNNNIIIKQNCLRLIRTINNFIDSNKLSEGFLDIEIHIYNLVYIIENIITTCNEYMKLRKTNLIFDPQYEEIYIKSDKGYIERIMLNILSNSLKYGKYNGNIYVTIKIENRKIVIEVVNDAETIPKEKRKKIFEKFTKINNSLSRPSEGSGLGLFLTKGLVEILGGKISISPGESYGNIFRIVLPYDERIQGKGSYNNSEIEIKELKQKIDIEFSDIYF